MSVLRKASAKFIHKRTITNNYVHMFRNVQDRDKIFDENSLLIEVFASIFIDIPILISMLYTDADKSIN